MFYRYGCRLLGRAVPDQKRRSSSSTPFSDTHSCPDLIRGRERSTTTRHARLSVPSTMLVARWRTAMSSSRDTPSALDQKIPRHWEKGTLRGLRVGWLPSYVLDEQSITFEKLVELKRAISVVFNTRDSNDSGTRDCWRMTSVTDWFDLALEFILYLRRKRWATGGKRFALQ